MRQFVALLVFFGWFATPTAAFANPGDEAAGTSGTGACALLTRDLAKQACPDLPDFLLDYPPEEEALGNGGSACDYATITLQIDAFTPAFVKQSGEKAADGWQPVSGVGDQAWFRDNRGMFAELIGSVGKRTFTIQMDIPTAGNADAVKPRAVELAQAIVVQLN